MSNWCFDRPLVHRQALTAAGSPYRYIVRTADVGFLGFQWVKYGIAGTADIQIYVTAATYEHMEADQDPSTNPLWVISADPVWDFATEPTDGIEGASQVLTVGNHGYTAILFEHTVSVDFDSYSLYAFGRSVA